MKEPALIELRSLAKVYGQGQAAVHALRGIDLVIERGEFVAVMGASGSGKSTCMNILGCLDTATSGSYRFLGAEVGGLDRRQRALLRRRWLGFVFQGFNLLARTSALENVELPLMYRGTPPAERRRQALEALDAVGLTGWQTHTPAELSGGQKQRIAILRALVIRPVRLFLDEPTSALDPEMTGEVLAMIEELKATGTQFVLVTHEMRFARRIADEVAFIANGRSIASGSSKAVLEQSDHPQVQAFLQRVLG